MPLIDGIIGNQNYELIRNRIGEILYTNIRNQEILTNTSIINAVDLERFVTYDETDMPVINVVLSSGTYDNKQQQQVDGEYKFFIAAYASEKTLGADRGDKRAAFKLHKILGLCRAILENPIYKRLDFPTPTSTTGNIKSTRVGGIYIPKVEDIDDAKNAVMGYLEFYVKVPEGVILLEPIPIALSTTEVKLYLTDKGYRWGSSDEIEFIMAENSTDAEPIYLIAE